jgi:hypothetical protein
VLSDRLDFAPRSFAITAWAIMQTLAILLAVLIPALCGYSGWLLGRLWQQKRRDRRVKRLRRRKALDSLDIIARGLLAEQVNVTEAALRMAVLLDKVEDPENPPGELAAIHGLARAGRHLDTGTERQGLPVREREIQDRQQEALEKRHADAVYRATRQLLRRIPEWR